MKNTAGAKDHGPDADYVVSPAENGLRLDRFLGLRVKGLSRERIQGIIRERVSVAGRNAKPSLRLRSGDTVAVRGREAAEPERVPPIRLLFADEALLAADKPAGLLCHPVGRVFRGTLVTSLRERLSLPELRVVHRLDRETSGVVVLARSKDASRRLSLAFKKGLPRKEYLAVLSGRCGLSHYTVEEPVPPGRSQAPLAATTIIERLGSALGNTLVRALPLTGRTHQIRFHARCIGHPVLGDERYGGAPGLKPQRLYLHAFRLTLPPAALMKPYPVFEAPIPEEFKPFLPADFR
jgi:RluA family pseudouridine synthase